MLLSSPLLQSRRFRPSPRRPQRYASPTGTGVGCTEAVPCPLTKAIAIAGLGDEVILNPGDYPLTTTVEELETITIRGVAGQPRPRLLFSGPSQQGLRLMHGSLLRDVEIEQAEDASALTTSGARIDRVVVKGAPANDLRGPASERPRSRRHRGR